MTRPYVPSSRAAQSHSLESGEPPPPTQLALPGRVLASMADELPRDAMQSIDDDTEAEAIEAEVIFDVNADDEVTRHGVSPGPAHEHHYGGSAAPPRRGELGGLNSEISSFRTRNSERPPAPSQELDALFGSTPDSRRDVRAPSAITGPSAPPPPPSKKLNAFASRMLFEPTPAPLEASFLPPPVAFSPASERPPGIPPSYRPPAPVSQPPAAYGSAISNSTHSAPFGSTIPFGAAPPFGSAPPFGGVPRRSNEDPDEETETRVLMRFDPPVTGHTLPPVPASMRGPTSSYPPASVPAFSPSRSYPALSSPNSGPQSVPPQTVSRLPSPATLPPRGPSGWLSIGGAGLLGAAAIAAAAFAFSPKKGELIVDVANQACNIVSNVNVYVDNELACTNTPCRLETAARSHVIYADAPGYPRTPAESVVVESGSVTLHKLQLGTGAETGVEVRTLLSGLTLSIDGKQVGTLPRRVPGLAPGEHLLRIEGGENYYPEERTVRVTENEISVLEPVTPKLKFGTLEVAASERLRDARVTINDKHVDVPYLQRLDASGRYHLVAQKNGYENFESWIGFDSNTPKQRVELQMAPKRESAAVAAVARAPRANIGASSSTATGDAFLNINSRPAAMVLLDGKPIGQTPRVGISVRPGAHAVIFVGPDGERRRLSANVGAGATKSVSVRF